MNQKAPSALQIGLNQVHGLVCLPVIELGFSLGKLYGIMPLVPIFIGGFALLWSFGLPFILNCKDKGKPLNTTQVIRKILGESASIVFAWIFSFVLLGWYGVNLHLTVKALHSEFNISSLLLISSMSFLIVSHQKLLQISGAAATIFIGMMVAYPLLSGSWESTSASLNESPNPIYWIFIIFALCNLAVIDFPTYLSKLNSRRQILTTYSSIVLLGWPMVLSIAGFLGAHCTQPTFLQAILSTIDSPLVKGCCFATIILCTITTNNLNLFSTYKALQNKLNITSYKLIFMLACIGTMFSFILEIFPMQTLILLFSLPIVCSSAFVFSRVDAKNISSTFKSLLFLIGLTWGAALILDFLQFYNDLAFIQVVLVIVVPIYLSKVLNSFSALVFSTKS